MTARLQKRRTAAKAQSAKPPAITVDMWPTDRLVPYERNPRQNANAVAKVAASLKEFGWRQPIVVDEKMVVIAGHTRLLAAQELGMSEVPVHVARGLSATQAKAYRLMDNRSGEEAEWDDALLTTELADLVAVGYDSALTGFDDTEIAALLDEEAASRAQAAASVDLTPPTVPRSKPGHIYELGQHRLLCGDSTSAVDMARLLDGTAADLCLTDPPYCSGGFQEAGRASGSVGTSAPHKQIANDRLSTRGYQALLKQAFANSGAAYLYAFTDWRMWVWLFDIAESCGYGVRSMIVWDKGTPGMGRGWRSQHELILWGAKENPPFDKHASGCGNVIGEKRTGNVLHTTEKPTQLVVALLENTPFARAVVDPFAGSGTTLVACESAGRKCFAVELDPAYCDVIRRRYAEFVGKPELAP